MSNFKKLMRQFREDRGKSLRELAEESGLTFSTIWKMEMPAHPLPRGATLSAVLRNGYGLTPSSPEFTKLVGAWTTERSLGGAVPAPDSRKEVVEHVAGLPKAEYDLLNYLLRDPVLWDMVQGMVKSHRKASR